MCCCGVGIPICCLYGFCGIAIIACCCIIAFVGIMAFCGIMHCCGYPIPSIPACALQGIAARWLSAHYKTIARVIARAIPRGLGFVTPCPNKQGKNAYFSKVSDASGTACDTVNVRKDCLHFGPPLWVIPVEERGPFGGPS